jgi:hypothetical protein
MEEDKTVLKRITCNRWGYVLVYDIYGEKINELSGQITYKKYLEIESRSMKGITVFDGLEHYRCISCELKKNEDEATC